MRLNKKEKFAFARSCDFWGGNGSWERSPRAFTLVEVIVVISIITLLMSISLPVFTRVRQSARWVITMNNQREIVTAINQFACDNDDSYPDSVASITYEYDEDWNWLAPTVMTTCFQRPGQKYRSMSSYLSRYIDNPDILFCPNAPTKNEYLHQVWEAGENWGNPDTSHDADQFLGVYCFYWDYIGKLEGSKFDFRGPRGSYDSGNESSVLVSCYMGYNPYRSPGSFESCEKFNDSIISYFDNESDISYSEEDSSDCWRLNTACAAEDVDLIKIKLHAGFTDGHVEAYSPSETVKMDVKGYSSDSMGRPGSFYLPEKGLPERTLRSLK